MMGGRVVLREVIGKVDGTLSLIYNEMNLAGAVMNPIEPHVDKF